tara:strand:- start:143 stop:925 length:783 start_codon:yes stop_codon:yes gene_type:complete
MIITTSNILLGKSPLIHTGASSDLPSNVTNQDFSLFYTSSDQRRLTLDFGATSEISYIAVAGTNIEGDKSGGSRVRCYDVIGGVQTLIQTVNVKRNQVVVIIFEPRTFTDLRIGLFNEASTESPKLPFCAAGNYLTVPNSGEVSGYDRQYLKRNFKNKTTVNNLSQPISQLRKRVPAKGVLNLPNITKSFSENEWQDFLDFSQNNYFFISEDPTISDSVFSGKNMSSYLCYDVGKNTVTAHSQTRELNNLSLAFKVLNGL